MKTTTISALAIIFGCVYTALAEPSSEEILFAGFKSNIETESYVIVIFSAKNDHSVNKPSLDFQGTIVGIINGRREIGDKVYFNRTSESLMKSENYIGDMYVIQYHKASDDESPISGQFYVDPQRPGAFVRCTKKLFSLVNEANYGTDKASGGGNLPPPNDQEPPKSED